MVLPFPFILCKGDFTHSSMITFRCYSQVLLYKGLLMFHIVSFGSYCSIRCCYFPNACNQGNIFLSHYLFICDIGILCVVLKNDSVQNTTCNNGKVLDDLLNIST